MNRLLRNSCLILLSVLYLTGCQPHTTYHSFHLIPDDGWNKSDTLLFSIPRQQLVSPCEVSIEIRHTTEISSRVLWIVAYINTEDSLHFSADTLRCVLADKKGKFNGSGLNHFYQNSFLLTTLHWDKPYAPLIKLAHCMDKGRIEGISDVGIRLQTAGAK